MCLCLKHPDQLRRNAHVLRPFARQLLRRAIGCFRALDAARDVDAVGRVPGRAARAARWRRPLSSGQDQGSLGGGRHVAASRLETTKKRIEAIEATRLPTRNPGTLFTLFTLLAYLNYTLQTPNRSPEPSDSL